MSTRSLERRLVRMIHPASRLPPQIHGVQRVRVVAGRREEESIDSVREGSEGPRFGMAAAQSTPGDGRHPVYSRAAAVEDARATLGNSPRRRSGSCGRCCARPAHARSASTGGSRRRRSLLLARPGRLTIARIMPSRCLGRAPSGREANTAKVIMGPGRPCRLNTKGEAIPRGDQRRSPAPSWVSANPGCLPIPQLKTVKRS